MQFSSDWGVTRLHIMLESTTRSYTTPHYTWSLDMYLNNEGGFTPLHNPTQTRLEDDTCQCVTCLSQFADLYKGLVPAPLRKQPQHISCSTCAGGHTRGLLLISRCCRSFRNRYEGGIMAILLQLRSRRTSGVSVSSAGNWCSKYPNISVTFVFSIS